MRVLMCPPTHYRIAWEEPRYNRHMKMDRQPDFEIAHAQWAGLVKRYQDRGVKVDFINPGAHLPDMTFTANGGWVHHGQFIVSNFAPDSRKGESRLYEDWGRECFATAALLPVGFEGQGDIVATRDAYLYCHGARNDPRVPQMLERFVGPLDRPMHTLRLVTGTDFYHGDLALFYIRRMHMLWYCPFAFDAASLTIIESLGCELRAFPPEFAVQDAGPDRRNFPLNAVDLGDAIVVPWGLPEDAFPNDLRDWLFANGVEIIFRNLSEFGKSGAGAKCLTLVLEE